MNQYLVTPAMGKRLMAKGLLAHPAIRTALKTATVVIVSGTTNGYVAEEVLKHLGQSAGFSRDGFYRGRTLPPKRPAAVAEPKASKKTAPSDVVIVNGTWQKGKTVFEVVDSLKEGDIILKGANALDVEHRRAAVYIGDPKAGTIGAALQAVVGRRVRLILPVGLEKRVTGDLDALAAKVNVPGAKGPRLLPVPGEVFTEIDALRVLAGVSTVIVAAGGVLGAEGGVWLGMDGEPAQVDAAMEVLRSISGEPPFADGLSAAGQSA